MEKSLEILKEILNESDHNIITIKIAIFEILKDYDKIIELAEQVLKSNCFGYEFSNHIGSTYLSKNKLDLAYEYLKKSYDLNKYQLGLSIDIGNYFAKKRQYEKAIEFYQEEIIKFPEQADDIKLLNNISRSYFKMKDYDKALEYIDKALSYSTINSRLNIHKGIILYKIEIERNKTEELKESGKIFTDIGFISPNLLLDIKSYMDDIKNRLNDQNTKTEYPKQQEFYEFKLYKREPILKTAQKKYNQQLSVQEKIENGRYPNIGDKNLYPLTWADYREN